MPLYQSANFSTTAGDSGSWALWRIDEPEDQLLAQLDKHCFLLDELQQIKVEQRRQEWMGCRLALQSLLPEGGAVQLGKNEHGRPFLQLSNWHVSLSHAYPFAAAAIHPQRPVGLDIEKPRPQLLRIKHKFLSQQEQAWAGDDLRQLCLLWAAKEALYKLKGQPGLAFAQDMYIGQEEGSEALRAFLFGKVYELHYQWLDSLLLCVVV